MINDYQTNVVYLADGIRHYMPLAINLFNALESAGVETHLLRHTESAKHVWLGTICRCSWTRNISFSTATLRII